MNNIFIEGSIACCPHLVKFLQGKVLCIGTYSKGGLKVPLSVVDLGEGPRGPEYHPPPPYFGWKRKKWQKEEKPAGQVKQNRAPSFAQSLDPPLTV